MYNILLHILHINSEMTEFENLQQIMKDDKSLFSMDNTIICQILNQLVKYREKYRQNIFDKYFESYKFELDFTEFLENKVAISGIKYDFMFRESGSGSSEYGNIVSFLQKRYNLIISKKWNTTKAKVYFSKYNNENEDENEDENKDENENENFEFEIDARKNIKLPKKIFDLYACCGIGRREIIVHLMVNICVISGVICILH
jgi:hypothetical protein